MLKVLKKGNVLKNKKTWKSLQNVVNLLFGCSAFLGLMYPPLLSVLTPQNLIAVTSAISAFNVYFTVATTDTIGL